MMPQILDCLVIGAGPAGLTAAIYLSRFHLRIAVIDAGQSRAAMIPRTHNHAGYPGGIAGTELLARMREQACEFGVEVEQALVEKLERSEDGFLVHLAGRVVATRAVLLASGVVNNRPRIAPEIHDVALERGLLRYCPICDGYEVTDKRVGVIGSGEHGTAEALFLRTFTRDVSLIASDGEHAFSDQDRQRLRDADVTLIDGPCQPLRIEGGQLVVPTAEGEWAYDSVYPALGSVIRSELAVALGAEASDEGCLVIDVHQRTSLPGLYAAGDVTKGLDQISNAMGQAAVASTAIRNDLAKDAPLLRER